MFLQEFDTNNPPPYSAKVIEDKRKKLREGLKKIYQYFVRKFKIFNFSLVLKNQFLSRIKKIKASRFK